MAIGRQIAGLDRKAAGVRTRGRRVHSVLPGHGEMYGCLKGQSVRMHKTEVRSAQNVSNYKYVPYHHNKAHYVTTKKPVQRLNVGK